MKLSFMFLTLFGFSVAQADGHGPDARPFKEALKVFSETCTEVVCEAPNEVKELFSREKDLTMPKATIKLFEQIAWDQAQIWGDTILEGDYQAQGDTRLDAIYGLYRDSKLVGYRITYSETAWDTSQCEYDGKNTETLQTCQAGRIVESSFVSPTLKTFIVDQNQFAEFRPN